MNKKQLENIFTDIRFWIMFFFLLRLIGITNPPIEIGHNWRQALTNMIARNFLEGNSNILYPTIDMSGNGSGIIGSEFPFYNYLIYLVSSVFGYTHWYGRLINLVVSSVGIYFFYKLAARISNSKIAFYAALLTLTSIWFAFSRKIMPDTFSVSLVIIGLYCGYRYFTDGKTYQILMYFLFITTGMLCKIPALSLVSVVFLSLFIKETAIPRKLWMLFCTGISIGIVSLWYFYWVPYLVHTYQFALYFPKGLWEGLLEILPLWKDFFEKFIFTSFYSIVAFLLFALGAYYFFKSATFYLKAGLSIISVVFFLFILKTGAVFPLHNYYIIPFIPVMAIIAGYGLFNVPKKIQYVLLALAATEGIANQLHDFRLPAAEKYKLNLEASVNLHIPAHELVVINGTQSPQELYFTHRKGWTISNEVITKSQIDSLANLGAAYLIINTKSFANPIDYYPRLFSGDHYDIFKLK